MPTAPTIKPDGVAEHRTTLIPRYKVLLHNDDVNTMEHVVQSLGRVFKFDLRTCERIMLEAHYQGVAVCTVEPFEQAELHRNQLLACSLLASLEQE